ncbi:MAG: NUDIX domain-containing protein [Burkholderiaceae bacterium]
MARVPAPALRQGLDPARLQALIDEHLRLARTAADDTRLPLEIADKVVGSVLPDDARLLADAVPGLLLADDCLAVLPQCASDGDPVLAAMARVLREAGRAHRWRNELLPVCADDGTWMGSIERACVRTLGIRTFAVHLVGEADAGNDDYACWLQRRAAHKDTDPGCLDNLASGLVGLADDARGIEPLREAVLREAAEEAGLAAGELLGLQAVGTWRMSGPVPEGHLVEDVSVFSAQLAPDATPRIVDGEVSEFLRLSGTELLTRIRARELTPGAAVAAMQCVQRWQQAQPGRANRG